jgi:hypothetical protein
LCVWQLVTAVQTDANGSIGGGEPGVERGAQNGAHILNVELVKSDLSELVENRKLGQSLSRGRGRGDISSNGEVDTRDGWRCGKEVSGARRDA